MEPRPHPPRLRDGFGVPAGPTTSDKRHVLVAGRSEITRVVVCRILERAGLRPVSATPDDATPLLARLRPGAVVLDGGADNRDCDGLLADIEASRRLSGDGSPRVVLLSNRNGTPLTLGLPAAVDAAVTKPITSERLRPVVERLIGRALR
ncbi:MAG TPA: response regulator [Mesorhizobium sp.]|nr:response regulator [Mesorhizobium sp.]